MKIIIITIMKKKKNLWIISYLIKNLIWIMKSNRMKISKCNINNNKSHNQIILINILWKLIKINILFQGTVFKLQIKAKILCLHLTNLIFNIIILIIAQISINTIFNFLPAKMINLSILTNFKAFICNSHNNKHNNKK